MSETSDYHDTLEAQSLLSENERSVTRYNLGCIVLFILPICLILFLLCLLLYTLSLRMRPLLGSQIF